MECLLITHSTKFKRTRGFVGKLSVILKRNSCEIPNKPSLKYSKINLNTLMRAEGVRSTPSAVLRTILYQSLKNKVLVVLKISSHLRNPASLSFADLGFEFLQFLEKPPTKLVECFPRGHLLNMTISITPN
jgi:hypothetical protein